MNFETFFMSCPEREATLADSLTSLEASGWLGPTEVVLDDGTGSTGLGRIHRTWRRMLRRAAKSTADLVLLCEDDVVFGRWFAENLLSWTLLDPLPGSGAMYASLYNPGRPFLIRRESERCLIVDPRFVWGAQALLLTPRTARFVDAAWDDCDGNPDQRMPLIASRVTPIYYHLPSLVDHAPAASTWGGIDHRAIDFDAEWRACNPGATDKKKRMTLPNHLAGHAR